jgi:PHP family Zn ribbon phosphoesterase
METIKKFQIFIDEKKSAIKNVPEKFGVQLIVNELEEIVGEESQLLIMGLSATISEVEKLVHELNGVFIPAHVDKSVNSIYSQIGILPDNLSMDAIEFSSNTTKEEVLDRHPELSAYSLISNSDAHMPDRIGCRTTKYYLKEPSFKEWKMALAGKQNRRFKV